MAAAAPAPLAAQTASSATLRLALIEDTPFRVATVLDKPLERLLKLSPSSGFLLDVQVLPCYYAGSDFRFRIPQAGEVEAAQLPGVALESDSEAALIYPPVPSLVEGLIRQARDPASFRMPWSIRVSSRPVTLTQARGPEGEALVSALLDASSENARWHNTVAVLYKLRWEDQDVSIILAGRVFGGLGRLATALEQERARGPLIGVARGGLFSSYLPQLRGQGLARALERLGLKYSVAGNSELRHWSDFSAYRFANPAGVEFLSANLVYSSAPATTLFRDSVVLEQDGLKVALVGLTPPSGAKYLAQAGLTHVSISDPQTALEARLPALRAAADAVILLVDVTDDTERLTRAIRGVDLIVGRNESYPGAAPPPESRISQAARPEYHPPLRVTRSFGGSLTVLEAAIVARRGESDWTLSERHRLLDASIPEAPGLPEFDPQAYGITLSTEPPLIPSARRIFAASGGMSRQLESHDVWTLAASLLARETGSEIALLRVFPLPVYVDGEIKESVARAWLNSEEAAVVMSLKGSELKPLLAEAVLQRQREEAGQPAGGTIRFTAGGVEPGPKVHGVPLENDTLYRVVVSRVLADALGLSRNHAMHPLKQSVDQLALDGLHKSSGSDPSLYRSWMEGRPTGSNALWKINFRDLGLNIQNTKIVRDDSFNAVPNSRIQGFDELLIGGVLKTDADYLLEPLRWSNTLEMEYARSKLRPRNQPAVTNTTANRISFLTTGTRRAGLIRPDWLARSWGPSLGVQFDGQFESTPGLRRRQIYSAYPGLQFYDGTWIRTLELSGNVKRDLSRDPPNTQTGLHTRMLLSKEVGPGHMRLQGEFFTNYFFLTRHDTDQDLRLEGDAQIKLRMPIRKFMTIAPFIDFYFFALKVRPVWGYSAMTGVTIGFSRLWKPQYEGLLGEK